MSALQAAVIAVQWDERARIRARQERVARTLQDAVSGAGILRPILGPEETVHLLPCLVPGDADPTLPHRIRCILYDLGVQTEDPYPVLLGGPEALPNAHALASRLVLVPCGAALAGSTLGRVASAVIAAASEVPGGRS
jgi:dTDP-4-amino-4,6-dideoxygalactose transaminase